MVDLQAVCDEVGVSLEDFKHMCYRDANLAMKRRLVCYILRNRYGLSYVEIERLTTLDRKGVAQGLAIINAISRNIDLITKHVDFDDMRP